MLGTTQRWRKCSVRSVTTFVAFSSLLATAEPNIPQNNIQIGILPSLNVILVLS
jgi:hypothetical protein